jgi:very-short-patch-repair endonuclease
MILLCQHCGKSFQRTGARAAQARFCSMACKSAASNARDLTCGVCGDTFRACGERASTAKFCSQRCKGIAARVQFTCETCGTVSYGYQNRNKRWCSRACASEARKTGFEHACAQCGTSFYASRAGAKFCSLSCHNINQGHAKTTHVCKVCGTEFRWSPSRSASGNYRITYCSLACRDADPERRKMLLRMNTALQSIRTTSAEAAGYAILDVLGVEYSRQIPFGGKFTPDAVVPSAHLVVQFDGDYWHDRAGTSTEPRVVRRVALDRSQDAYVRSCGWEVIRLWASDLRADPDGCADKISQLLHRPLGHAPARDPLASAPGTNAQPRNRAQVAHSGPVDHLVHPNPNR